ncbi:thioredoxin-like protein [Pelagophyceae sp. CCMP2097]|nr:thioredoxin-like protein [Pelagophyceae sp. CCMP2097]
MAERRESIADRVSAPVWQHALRLGASFPNLSCSSTHGSIPSTHLDFGASWVVLVTQPTRRNAVSTTELAELERLKPHFDDRGCKLYVLTCASVRQNKDWLADVVAATGYAVSFPLLCDDDFEIAGILGLVPSDFEDDADGLDDSLRTLYIIAPDKKIRMMQTYPCCTGFSSFEILRCLDSLIRAKVGLMTPANWVQGRDTFLQPDIETADAAGRFPRGLRSVELPSGLDYLRITPDPLQSQAGRRDSETPPAYAQAPQTAPTANAAAAYALVGAPAPAEAADAPA